MTSNSGEIAGLVKDDAPIVSVFAPAQNALLFCLQPETFPVFVAWLRQHQDMPEEWFDNDAIARDLRESVRSMAQLMELG